MDEPGRLLAEFKYWLDREGISLSPERIAGALADYADVRHHVDVVAAASPREEPATVVALLRLPQPRTTSA